MQSEFVDGCNSIRRSLSKLLKCSYQPLITHLCVVSLFCSSLCKFGSVSSGLRSNVTVRHSSVSFETQVVSIFTSSQKLFYINACAWMRLTLVLRRCERVHYCTDRVSFYKLYGNLRLCAFLVVLYFFERLCLRPSMAALRLCRRWNLRNSWVVLSVFARLCFCASSVVLCLHELFCRSSALLN